MSLHHHTLYQRATLIACFLQSVFCFVFVFVAVTLIKGQKEGWEESRVVL